MLLLVVLVHAQDFVPLTSIKTLTLHKGKLTRGRRGAPVQQLDCVGGDACQRFQPQVMQCYNQGTDHSGEVQWTCKAEMEDLYRLGTTTVSCEGYLSSEDSNVLTGSCGVEYTLHLTEKGKRHFFPPRTQKVVYSPPQKSSPRVVTREEPTILGLFVLLVVASILCVAFMLCMNASPSQHHHHYATRSQAPTPVVVHETPIYHTAPAPVIIDNTPPVVVRNRGRRVVVEEPYHYEAPSAPPPSPPRSPSPVRHYTSTGYGGTKKR